MCENSKLTSDPSLNNPTLRAYSMYAGYCVRGSIQPLPIAIPAKGTSWKLSRTSFAVFARAGYFLLSRERAVATRGRGAKEEKRERTNIRYILTSEALACDVSLYRSLDHGPRIRKRKEHNAFQVPDIPPSGRHKGTHRPGDLATPGDRRKTGYADGLGTTGKWLSLIEVNGTLPCQK